MKVAFIGLGVMGGHMARHLAESYDLTVYDIDASRMKPFDGIGTRLAASVTDAVERTDLVMLSLPTSEAVREVAIGEAGAATTMAQGSVLIDLSTTAPEITQLVANHLRKCGVSFLDAPVSGGEGGARDATLAIMVGGDEATFARCKPVLEVIGGTVTRMGEVGAGGVAKLVNNMIVGAAFAVIAESFALGKECGLDPGVLYQAIRGGWAGSPVLDVAAPGMINGNYEPGGSLDMHFKDIGYALALARSRNCPTPMTAAVDEIFKAARASGRGQKAQHVIVQLWEDLGIGRR
jgi:2-hydroxy-3-oxopropionate reductase